MKSKFYTIPVVALVFATANILSSTPATAQVINTIAGTGTGGFSGDGAAATSAQLRNPSSVKVTAAGNIYIADYLNHRIRMIDAAGNISTIGGNGSAGFAGDGGPATAASLRQPTAIAFDPSGNLYITDNINDRIRMISPSGTITTVAGTGTGGYTGDGGAATAATLDNPHGINTDAAGNIYFAEPDHNAIRKITVATGIITTVAGTGTAGFTGDGGAATAAQLNQPRDVVVDGAGNMYIADCANHCIRKVDASGNISTIGGTGSAGFSGDGSLATSGRFNFPCRLWIDVADNLLIYDSGNNRVRKITAGILSTVAGNGTYGFAGDSGPATAAQLKGLAITGDAAGNIYIADEGNHRIRKITPAPLTISGTPVMCAGGTATITPSVTGGTWSSGATTIATVDAAGVVTGVSAGTAEITYTTATSTATKTATVNALPEAITGTTTVCIAATTTLSSPTAGGTWASSSAATASIDAAGVVTGVAAGTAGITYTLATGCKTATSVTVIACPTGIGTTMQAVTTMNIYPNPSDGTFFVVLPENEVPNAITVTDMVGRVIRSKAPVAGTNHMQLKGIPAGSYVVKAVTNSSTYVATIIISH